MFSDTEPPDLTCEDITGYTDEGLMTSSTIMIDPLVTDNVDNSPNVTCSHNTGYPFNVGVTLVTCTAVDQSGNEMTCSFNVTVLGKNLDFVHCGKVALLHPNTQPKYFFCPKHHC